MKVISNYNLRLLSKRRFQKRLLKAVTRPSGGFYNLFKNKILFYIEIKSIFKGELNLVVV